jgi:16S rRNA (cytosine967-C5)-methyltransferase
VTGPPVKGQRRPTGPRRRKPAPDVPRRVAFDLLRAVDERDAYANLTLPGLLRDRGLDGRDAAFATELSYGTLRGRGTYDAVLAACVDRPLDQVDLPVLDLLRLGAHQLLAMRVPPHAAVGATVELARAVAGEGRSSFVNAVLRKVGRQDLPTWLDQVAPSADVDPLGNLAVVHSHPGWVVSAFRDALGGSLAETAALLAADNAPPQVMLVARPGRAELAELVAAGAAPGRWSPYAAVLPGGDPGALPAVRQGRAGVQDEGSQLVALALADAPLDGTDARWLDLCAGPGGKAALLAAVAAGRGAGLLAAELAPHRARLVRNALGDVADPDATGGGWAEVVVADGRAPAWRPGSLDRVLVDAPCTGLGALRRRPEARWRRQPEDVAALASLQRDLLASALDAVRPGGLVAYVVCSPHLAETRTVVADVLRHREPGPVERVDARPLLPGVPDLGDGPDLQLWPHRHGTDAMYLALLRRL